MQDKHKEMHLKINEAVRMLAVLDEEDDSETFHMREDGIKDQFIAFVASLDIPEVSEMAKKLDGVTKIGIPRWYA